MEKVVVVFVCDDGYVMQTAVAITSLIQNKHSQSVYDIYVLGTQLRDVSVALLQSMERENVRITVLQAVVDAALRNREEADSKYRVATKAALLKFEIANLLNEDKAIYLDGDIIVRRDLSELYGVQLDGRCAAVVRDVPQVLFDTPLMDTGTGQDYFNSGVMVLNLRYIRERGLREELISTKQSLHDDTLMDQNVLNLVFGKNVVHLPLKYNVLYANLVRSWTKHDVEARLERLYGTGYHVPKDVLNDAVVIHYSSKDKPWKYFDAPAAQEWMEYYKQSPFAQEPLHRRCLLKQRVCRKAARITRSFVHRVRARLNFTVFRLASYISPVWNTQLRFLEERGKLADLKNPKTFPEKLSWLKLNCYAHDPLVKQCADKLRVREYVKEVGLGHMLNELIDVYQAPEDINWDTLPERFALKWNFGCSYNYVCQDKSKVEIKALMRQLRKWQRREFWPFYAELQYRGVEKCIICERYLNSTPENPLLDYKFYCFHGEPLAVLVIARPEDGDKAAVFMSPDWELISDIPARYKHTMLPERPASLDRMVAAARALAQPFPFVRVDLYEYEGRPLFGEMTFTPGAGIFPSETAINGKPMGEYLQLDMG